MVNYFFDSYALIAITQNNPSYIRFMEEVIVTSEFNLAEVVFISMLERGEKFAKTAFSKFKESKIAISEDVLFKAMIFRIQNKKKGFSYADAIGYTMALENNLKFLTGDDAFRDMQNVEFVK